MSAVSMQRQALRALEWHAKPEALSTKNPDTVPLGSPDSLIRKPFAGDLAICLDP